MRFKVGDKVMLHKPVGERRNKELKWMEYFNPLVGRVFTIVFADDDDTYQVEEVPYWFQGSWLELMKGAEMQKKDLEDGDIVEFVDGRRAVVWDSYFMMSPRKDLVMSSWTNDLINTGSLGHRLDVIKVKKQPAYPFEYLKDNTFPTSWSWERRDIKEVTMAEVEEKFGCKVKIIKGDNE